jgi:hypothetical protein
MTDPTLPTQLLPADLAGLPEPGDLGARVRAGEVRLDWSRVAALDADVLALLLAPVDAVADAAALALATLAPALRPVVEDELEVAALRRQRAAARAAATPPAPAPAVVEPAPSAAPLLAPPSMRAIRDELVDLALADLRGPIGGPRETLSDRRDSPIDLYPLGSLAPRERNEEVDDDAELATTGTSGTDDNAPNPGAPAPRRRRPSALGLSCSVDPAEREIRVRARWGAYHRVDADDAADPVVADASGEGPARVWQRVPQESAWVTIPLRTERAQTELVDDDGAGQIELAWRVRRKGEGPWLVTIFLANGRTEPARNKARAWLFQAELEVAGVDDRAVFVARPARSRPDDKEEEARLTMVYRHRREFAVGHAIAVDAELAPGGERALRLRTTAAPRYEIAPTAAPDPGSDPRFAGLQLDMRQLAALDGPGVAAALAPLASGYRAWIAEQRARVATDPTFADHGYAPQAALASCEAAAERIEEGLALLRDDAQAARAFAFMQRAMADQRVRTTWVQGKKDDPGLPLAAVDVPRNHSWRPFQLAFILLGLPALTRLDHPGRSVDDTAIADLLWFPTGGGKTEAYLGLTAYTLAIRRLQGVVAGRDGGYGVGVLMRYTLRLLTLQQFQRAAALMCACEVVRAEDPATWGEEPFRLGLWVGSAATPNTTERAADSQRGGGVGQGTVAQLQACPWCGARIDPKRHIKVDVTRGRSLVYCGDGQECVFGQKKRPDEGLPVVLVDDEIYRLLPGLIIATVDKFARVPWLGKAAGLFGAVNKRCDRHGFWAPDLDDADSHRAAPGLPAARSHPALPARPLDLVIQDELHLIAGPLGSMVGLYETALDALWTWEVDGRPVRPKVVASTATIRRAATQVKALFLRDVQVFPPQGLDIEDSCFAREQSLAEVPGRLYLGICVPGMRHRTVLIRVYVALLAAAETLRQRYGAGLIDPYLTLLGYFGAIRELAAMMRAVQDDVPQRLAHMSERGLADRKDLRVDELTSRISSERIPAMLEALERPFTDARPRRGESWQERPLDVVLSTNMVSVGVDVPRLGLMVVAGQPKATAEYIQATSRVGRRHPGLVVTVYHGSRPRDLSHYERFGHDHATFYRNVEPLSVTPFSTGAVDRGLPAVLVALARHGDPALTPNGAAAQAPARKESLDRAVATIRRRADYIADDPLLRDQIGQRGQYLSEKWRSDAQKQVGSRLGYQGTSDGATRGLLGLAGSDDPGPFACPNSLRNVESPVPLILRVPQRDWGGEEQR